MLLFQLKSGDFEAVMVSMYYQGFDYREITFVGKVNSNPEAELKEFQPLAETPITGSNLKTLNNFQGNQPNLRRGSNSLNSGSFSSYFFLFSCFSCFLNF